MENKKLNEQESLALITQMIQNSKKGLVVGSGNSFLFWGYLTLAVSIAIFLLLYITGNQSWFPRCGRPKPLYFKGNTA